MRVLQTHVVTFFMLVAIIVTSAQKSSHIRNHHELSIAIDEMEKANYFSFVMLINMLQPVNPRFLANVTFLMPKDKTLSRSNIIHQDAVTEFLLRHSIPSPLLFEHLSLIPNGSIVPSSLPHYNLEISNGGRSNYFVNHVKIISRNICNLGSIKCHGIDGILPSPRSMDDISHGNNHTSPSISCPSIHNDSIHNSSVVPADHSGDYYNAPPPSRSPTHQLPKSESPSAREGDLLSLIFILILGLSVVMIGL